MENVTLKQLKKTIIVYSIIIAACFAISSFCFFINQMWIPLGFIIGYIIALLNLIILCNFSYYLTKPFARARLLSTLLFSIRMLLYGIGFLICILPQYYGYNIFFWGTCLASYMIMILIIGFLFK